jgi:hypothetical protein
MATIFEASYEQLKDAEAEIERLLALLAEAKSCLERGAYDLRQGGYLRSATILEECAVACEQKVSSDD